MTLQEMIKCSNRCHRGGIILRNIRNYLMRRQSERYFIIIFNIQFCGQLTLICEILKVFTTHSTTEWLELRNLIRHDIFDLKRKDFTGDFLFLPLSFTSMFSHTMFLSHYLSLSLRRFLSFSFLNFYHLLLSSFAEIITLILMIERPVNVLKSGRDQWLFSREFLIFSDKLF